MNSKNFNRINTKKALQALLLLLLPLLCPEALSGQCNSDDLLDRCASDLGTFNYIKTFEVNARQKRKKGIENPYVFSNGSVYKLIACNCTAEESKMIISLYDRDHNLLASTYNEESKKFYSEIQYPCNSTGVYYIRIAYDSGRDACGICILGFSKEK